MLRISMDPDPPKKNQFHLITELIRFDKIMKNNDEYLAMYEKLKKLRYWNDE